MGRAGIVHLVVILAFIADGVAVHADVAVRLDETGIYGQTLGIVNFRALAAQIRADRRDFVAIHQDVRLVRLCMNRIVNHAIFDQNHVKIRFLSPNIGKPNSL